MSEGMFSDIKAQFILLNKLFFQQVDYDNHVLFTGNKGRKQGSPVRIFTNLLPADIVIPTDEGYW